MGIGGWERAWKTFRSKQITYAVCLGTGAVEPSSTAGQEKSHVICCLQADGRRWLPKGKMISPSAVREKREGLWEAWRSWASRKGCLGA